jgi:UDP-glucose 4-epimerase
VKKINLDIRDLEGMRHVLKARFNIEHVLHLAAQPIVDTALTIHISR